MGDNEQQFAFTVEFRDLIADGFQKVADQINVINERLGQVSAPAGAADSSFAAMGSSVDDARAQFDALFPATDAVTAGLGEASAAAGVTSQAASNFGDTIGSVFKPAVEEGGTSVGWLTSQLSELGTNLEGFGEKVKGGLEDPMATAKGAVGGFLEELGPVGVGLSAVGVAVGAVGAALFELTSSTAEAGESVLDFSRVTNTAVEDVGSLSAAAEIGGSSLDGLQGMLTMLQRRMDATGPSADKFNAALADLNINAQTFRASDPTERIALLSEGMRTAADGTTRMSDALAIMGRAGVSNLPFLMKDFDDLKTQGEELGQTWSEQDTAAAEKFNESLKAMGVAFSTLKNTIGVQLLTDFVTGLQLIQNNGPLVADAMKALGVAATIATGPVGLLRAGLGMAGVDLPTVTDLYHKLTDALGNSALAAQTEAAQQDGVNRIWAQAMSDGTSAADAVDAVATKMLALKYSEKQVEDQTGLTREQIDELKQSLKDGQAAAASFADAWQTIFENSTKVAPSLAGISASTQALIVQEHEEGASVDKLKAAYPELADSIQLIIGTHDKAAAGHTAYMKAVDGLVQSLLGEAAHTLETVDAVHEVIDSGNTNIDVVQRTVTAIDGLVKQHAAVSQSTLDWANANRVVAGTTDALHGKLTQLGGLMPDISDYAHRLDLDFSDAHDAVNNLASSSIYFNEVETDTGAILGGDVIPMFTTLFDENGLVVDAKQRTDDLTVSVGGLAAAFDTTANQLPKIIESAFTGKGGVSGAMTAAGADLGKNLAGSIKTTVGDELPESMDNAIGGALGSIAGGIGGGLISKGVTMLVSWIGSLFDHGVSDIQAIGTKYGLSITDAMAKSIQQSMSSLGIGEQAATILNADQLFPTIDTSNLAQATSMVHDLFSMLQTGQVTATEASGELDKIFPQLAKAGTDAYGVLNKQLVDLIQLSSQYGTTSQAITDFMAGQGKAAATDFGAALKIPDDALKSYDTANALQMSLRVQMSQTSNPAQLASLQAQLDVAMQTVNTAGVLYDTTRVQSQATATAMGAALAATVNANVKAGMSFTDAVNAVAPAVSALQDQLEATGYDGGAAFAMLKGEVDLAHDAIAGPAITAVSSLTAGMVALTNTGQMTQGTFQGLGSQIGTTFQALVQQGKDGSAVMIAMQTPLQQLWEEQQQFGFKLDDTTQALVDEAQAQGIVGETHKSTTDQMLDALSTLHTDLEGITAALTGKGGVSDAFADLATNAKAQIGSIPTNYDLSVNLNGTWNAPPPPDNTNYASSGGVVTSTGMVPLQYFAKGLQAGPVQGFAPRGTDTQPAMLTPGEVVMNQDQQKSVLGNHAALVSSVTEMVDMSKRQAASVDRLSGQLPALVRDVVNGLGGRRLS